MKKIALTATAAALSLMGAAQPWAYDSLNINQVKTIANSNGDLFREGYNNAYEVPIDSGRHTMFAGALWIGGMDVNNSLHLAGQTYGLNGTDFFPGPVMYSSAYSAATDLAWNKVWKINKTTIDSFLLWRSNPAAYPGYTIPAVITSWPANGDLVAGQAPQLAPFVDANGDNFYDPNAGDYPCIKGDQALFLLFNDHRNTHMESGGQPLGVEIHVLLYAYSAPGTWLDSTVFINYRFYNRSSTTYTNAFWGNFNDFDIGSAFDDYVGCDVERSIAYGYNGDMNDGATAQPGNGTYGANPPAQGMVYLRGPEANPGDGIDNDRDGTTDEAGETWAMSHFQYYNNDFSVTGNPTAAQHYYNYMSGYWTDGTPVTYGGTGYGGTTNCDFMFPGNTDPLGWGTNFVPQAPWDEASSNNLPSDRRAVSSSGPFVMMPSHGICVDVAYVFGRGSNGPASSVAAMQNAADSAHAFYAGNNPCTCDENPLGISALTNTVAGIYPNPATESVNIICGNNATGAVVEILDATGKLVSSTTVLSGNSTVVDISGFAPGIYFVRVNKGSVVLTGKFVRN